MPAGAITPDAAKLLVTFMGFVAASVLPTATLMINSLSSNGRSVRLLLDLGSEMRRMLRALFVVLGLTGLSVLALVALAVPTPWRLPGLLDNWVVRSHIGQSLALASIFFTLDATRVIPRSFFRCLGLKLDIVVEEARQKTVDNAPKVGETSASFKTKPGFGTVRTLEEVRARS